MRSIAEAGKDACFPYSSSGTGSGVVLRYHAAAASLWMRLQQWHTAQQMAHPRLGQ